VLIEANVAAGADDMRAFQDREIFDNLRSGDCALGAWNGREGRGDVGGVGVLRDIWKRRIRLALREKKVEAREAQCERVDHRGENVCL